MVEISPVFFMVIKEQLSSTAHMRELHQALDTQILLVSRISSLLFCFFVFLLSVASMYKIRKSTVFHIRDC